ncbi:MAG: tRNA pseudouridine(55) synthase TruB [Actinomycetota bacterium]
MDGVLVIDKPSGVTSHDVVDAIRKKLGMKRVGHGGTLDPDATGVLLLGVGKATRFLSYAQAAPKRYTAVVSFGSATSTLDASGEVLASAPVDFSESDLNAALERFRGDIEQVPPMVSAIKIGGERLHAKARRGEEIDRPPRAVTIYELQLVSFTAGGETEATLDVRCSGGTYIRSLAHDLGQALGSGAHLKTLRRTEAGGFSISDALSIDEADASALRPLHEAVRLLPRVEVGPEDARLVANGRPLRLDVDIEEGASAAVVAGGELLAVYKREGARILPERVVPR